MKYFDYDWDLHKDRIVLDRELDIDKLEWRAGDHFEVRNIICSTLDELDKKNQYDLVISNYAFSEITRGLQDDYIDKVTRKSLRG
jgi:hypothetical protein